MSNNLSSKTSQALIELDHQLIILKEFDREQMFESEYIYNFTESCIILTVYLKTDLRLRSLHVIPIDTFQCFYLNKYIHLKTPQEITEFFSGTIHAVELILQVGMSSDSKALMTNFDRISQYLPTIFYESFLHKIQRRLKIKHLFQQMSLNK